MAVGPDEEEELCIAGGMTVAIDRREKGGCHLVLWVESLEIEAIRGMERQCDESVEIGV